MGLRVLVACEYSGVVREAFRKRGHDAWSCDLLPAEDDSPYHYTGDVLELLAIDLWRYRRSSFDLMIAHPPCTHLAVSGARWWKNKELEQAKALDFVSNLMLAPIKRIAIENPIGIISSAIRKPNQIIHPYQFGHPVSKATCLWLKGLPPLQPTDVVEPEWVTFPNGKRQSKWYYETSLAPHHLRGHLRSKTFTGIGEAMANQWG